MIAKEIEPEDIDLDPRQIPSVTLDGWRKFVEAKPAAFDLIDRNDYVQLGGAERLAYDDRRMSYHSELVIIETSTVRHITRQGRLLTLLNQRECGARRSLIVSGPWASGKTTTIKLLGKVHEQNVRRRYPGQDRIPVVYITTRPKGPLASWPPNSPTSSDCRPASDTTPPTSPTRSAMSSHKHEPNS